MKTAKFKVYPSRLLALPKSRQMSLAEWDEKVAPVLMFIELRSKFLNDDAKEILSLCERLPERASWETLAENELNKAIASMEEIVAALKKAKTVYESKHT